ncbi:glutathione S-transferase family protein [Erythrobacter tepidarius]|uniref:glutathione S-transferase family protein n=1 Tax=Erythrobacter tepidarius TaxID=60454 RepID=UPI000A3A0924|nr:glutathione S-transferase family protein [Erythrobacter tepidarius]
MAEFTFYTVALSRGQIARWALHETGADYTHEVFDWATRPATFRDINPMNKVPALVHHLPGGDQVITECAAINHYLAQTHPEAGLLPEAHEQAAYFRWLFFAAGPLEQAIIARSLGWEVPEGKSGTAGFGSLELVTDTLDKWLSAHDFIAGDRFTMADTYVGSQFIWGLRFGSIPERPSFRAYVERITQRPAYAEANAIDAAIIKAGQASA